MPSVRQSRQASCGRSMSTAAAACSRSFIPEKRFRKPHRESRLPPCWRAAGAGCFTKSLTLSSAVATCPSRKTDRNCQLQPPRQGFDPTMRLPRRPRQQRISCERCAKPPSRPGHPRSRACCSWRRRSAMPNMPSARHWTSCASGSRSSPSIAAPGISRPASSICWDAAWSYREKSIAATDTVSNGATASTSRIWTTQNADRLFHRQGPRREG